jgi:hypothetical protein
MDVLYVFWGATTLNPLQLPAFKSVEAKTVPWFSNKSLPMQDCRGPKQPFSSAIQYK